MIRPGGGDAFNVNRSVHWHVLSTFSYLTPDENAQTIDYVTATRQDGTVVEFIAAGQDHVAEDVQPDIDALEAVDRNVTLSCYDCHNRVGHDMLNPRDAPGLQAVHRASSTPRCRTSSARACGSCGASYPDEAAADAEIDKLSDFYQTSYPAGLRDQGRADRRRDRPDQGPLPPHGHAGHEGHGQRPTPTTWATLDCPGLLPLPRRRPLPGRGREADQGSPSRPPATRATPSRRSGPPSRACRSAAAQHATTTSSGCSTTRPSPRSLDPGGQTCGECHAKDYCVNCHSTGAVTVDHDEMTTNHAKVVREQGNTACAYCHLPGVLRPLPQGAGAAGHDAALAPGRRGR